MLPRTCILFRYVCRQTAWSPSYYVLQRNFKILACTNGSSYPLSQINSSPFSSFASSKVLCAKVKSENIGKTGKDKQDVSRGSNKANQDVSKSLKSEVNTPDSSVLNSEIKELNLNEALPGEKKKSIIDVIIKPKEAAEKDKLLLENVKEQSLDGPQALSADASQKVVEKIIEQKAAKPDLVKTARRRKPLDRSVSSVERNFITPNRAMSDFLLRPSDLESLPKTKRRSPYECEPPITVYWRKDVEAKALEVWGTKEKLFKELLKRNIERMKYQQNIFTVKRRLRDYRREIGKAASDTEVDESLMGRSGRVVLTAVAINASNCLFKLFAWLYTGSHSMFSECIHSLADTINQLILAYGIHKSVQIADSYHPYGYSNMKYVASLISGVGIFCVGTGLSLYHGITGLLVPHEVDDFFWAYFVLAGSLVSEGATALVALNSVRDGAKNCGMSVKEYIYRGQDPSVNVVLLEDFGAVIGVFVAASCMGLSSLTNSAVPDAFGSILVGGILGSVASFIIYTNVAALVGRSIPQENLDKINSELESDVMIRAIHDVKGIDMGNYLVRYKAEVDFDGRELARSYLDKQELNLLLEDVRKIENIDQLEEFLLKHGEAIVDLMGGEIDRIEMKLRKNHPEIRHCDLEIL